MAEIIATEELLDNVATLTSPKVREKVQSALTAIATFPESGSKDVPESVRRHFSDSVMKAYAPPFDFVYYYEKEADKVYALGLVHFRQAR